MKEMYCLYFYAYWELTRGWEESAEAVSFCVDNLVSLAKTYNVQDNANFPIFSDSDVMLKDMPRCYYYIKPIKTV